MLVPISLILNIPAIIYLKDKSILENSTEFDLRDRFYIVENKRDLESHINLYKLGKLEPKFSTDIVDRYAFNTSFKMPSELMSDFVKQRLSA